MQSFKLTSGWICLFHTLEIDVDIPHLLSNDYEYCMAHVHGLKIYNIHTNKWRDGISYLPDVPLMKKYPREIESISSCYDISNNTMYIYKFDGRLLQIDMNSNSCQEIISPRPMQRVTFPKMIFVDNQIHLIGGKDDSKFHRYVQHRIFCKETKQWIIHRTFSISDGKDLGDSGWNFNSFGLIYIKSRNQLLLLGGYSWVNKWASDAVYTYCMKDQEWRRHEIKLPERGGMCDFGYTITRNERYVLIFGGSRCRANKRRIYVLDLELMQIYLSTILCPHISDDFKAIIVTFPNEVLMHGFIRNYYSVERMPVDMIRLLCMFHVDDWVHLIDFEIGHWKMSVNDIIHDMKLIVSC